MPSQTLVRRVVSLEGRVDAIEALPQRIGDLELQMVQLREEMHTEFSSVRAEIKALDESLRAEITALDESLRAEITAGEKSLRAEIKAGDEETRHLMRVLHEDVIVRLTTIQPRGQ